MIALTLKILILLIMQDSFTIFDMASSHETQWQIIDDRVMGGKSQGSFSYSKDGVSAVFSGYVTTANNGGFSSVRYSFEPVFARKFKKVIMRIKGDGRSYQFRLKNSPYDRHSYVKTFNTTGEWETIEIQLSEMIPSFRGYQLDIPNFDQEYISEISFLIANKVKESFILEFTKIELL